MSILNHLTLGAKSLEEASTFYDATLGTLGVNNLGAMGDTGIMYGAEAPEFVVTLPRDGETACHANGGTVGFKAPSRAAVDQFHAAGLANGGSDEGAPGIRPFSPTAYGAYLRDPTGNKICAFCFAEE